MIDIDRQQRVQKHDVEYFKLVDVSSDEKC
jgi:hypothetical protein